MNLNEKIVNGFNGFLRIKDYKSPPKTKIKRYLFITKYLVKNKLITVKGYQLCSTYISRELGVSVAVVRKWILQLQKQKILLCTNSKYIPKHRSKEYILTDFGREIVNELNGYNEKSNKFRIKKEHRTKKWQKFDKYSYDFNQCVYLTSGYLGCPESLIKDLKAKMAIELLEIPRINNINESKFLDFYYAYNHCIKVHNDLGKNYSKLSKKEFKKLVFKHFGEVELNYHILVAGQYSDKVLSSLHYKLKFIKEFLYSAPKNNPKLTKKMRKMAKSLRKLIRFNQYDWTGFTGFCISYDTILDGGYLVDNDDNFPL